MRRLIAIVLLGAALTGTFMGVLPASGVDWVFLAAFCIGAIAAVRQGRVLANMAFLVAAAILIQALINILGLSPLTKIVNGALLVLAIWRFPDGLDLRVKKKNEDGGVSRGTGTASAWAGVSGNTAQSVFEEFKAFTQAQQGDDGRSADEGSSKPEKKERRRRSHGKRGSRSREDSSKSLKPRSSSKPAPKQDEKPKRDRKPSGRRRSSDKNGPDLGKAQAALQAQQHAVQQDKQRLKDERAASEQKRKAEEARLRREREAFEREKAALSTAQPVKQTKPDDRSPEVIMGLNNPGYSFQDLKDARKREVARWHTSSMGNKPKELVELAEEELKKINLAYDRLKKKFE